MENSRLIDLIRLSEPSRECPVRDPVPPPPFRWKTRVLIPGAIVGSFLLLLAGVAYREFVPLVSVEVTPVVLKRTSAQAPGAVMVQAAGWLEADPYKSYVTALADGIVREVLVLEGESVTTDQIVARLVNEDARLAVQRAEAKVRELEGSLDAAHAELAAATADWENPVERRRAIDVAEAQLAESVARLQQLSAEIMEGESRLEQAKSDHDRGAGLHESKSISDAEMVRLRSNYHAQKAKLNATRMRHTAVKELKVKHEADLRAAREHMRLRTEERRRLEAARASVVQAEAALSQSRTALAEAKLRLERMNIRSPMDGVIMARLTEPGSKVVVISDNQASARVLSLYDPKRMQARVDVPLVDAAKVGVGQPAEIVVDVLPDRTFSGAVTRVLHEANIQKNTLEVKVALADPDPQLRPEMLARVRFLAKGDGDKPREAEKAFVPETAVRNVGGAFQVWVVREFDGLRGRAAARSVQIGRIRMDGWLDVLDGVQAGDLVISRAAGDLKEGAWVKVLSGSNGR
ncbi:MAG: efflux RND transporter periplasmic adaptor subunit [Desulfomonile sp.]|nr:efflux RND transporter periplasmic adaptor subunit [Desulfomonile sp.]